MGKVCGKMRIKSVDLHTPVSLSCTPVCDYLVNTYPFMDMSVLTLAQLLVLFIWCIALKCLIYRRTTSLAGTHNTITMHQWVMTVLSTWAEALVVYFLVRYHEE